MCRLKIKVDKMISKGREEDILHWQACSAWNDAFRLWPSPPPPPCKLASLKPRTLPDSRPPDPSLYGMTQIYTSGWNFAENNFNTREGPILTTWLLTMCHTLSMMISCPPFSACPCPASIKRVRQAAGWAEGEKRSGTISNGIVTAIAIVRSGGAGTVTMDGGTLIHQPIVMTHRRCGLKKPNTSHSILGWHQPKLDQNPELIFDNLWLDLTIMETQKPMFRDNQTISDDGLFVFPSNILSLSLFLLA